MNLLLATIKRDLVVAFRHLADVANPLVFFVIVISLFPLGVGPDQSSLAPIAPGVVWVAALLSTLLSLDLVFKSDFEDGSLEQVAVSKQPMVVIVLGKVISHWIVSGLPLTVLSPLLGYMLYLNGDGRIALLASLALGTPILSLIGAIGASLTVGLRKGGVLVSILVLPLYVPVLILGATMVAAGAEGLPYLGQMLWLGAMLALAISLSPIAAAAGLRISISH